MERRSFLKWLGLGSLGATIKPSEEFEPETLTCNQHMYPPVGHPDVDRIQCSGLVPKDVALDFSSSNSYNVETL